MTILGVILRYDVQVTVLSGVGSDKSLSVDNPGIVVEMLSFAALTIHLVSQRVIQLAQGQALMLCSAHRNQMHVSTYMHDCHDN